MPFLPAVVDLPTPPFPDATKTIFFTPVIGRFLGKPLAIISFWRSPMALERPEVPCSELK